MEPAAKKQKTENHNDDHNDDDVMSDSEDECYPDPLCRLKAACRPLLEKLHGADRPEAPDNEYCNSDSEADYDMSKVPEEKKEDVVHIPSHNTAFNFMFDTRLRLNFPMVKAKGWKLPFPIYEDVGEKLISLCDKAPFGKGSETVYDDKVRKAFEIKADDLEIMSGWQDALASDSTKSPILEQIRSLLAPYSSHISSELYKLQVYAPGGHFAFHRDTQRSANHFATLLVSLPSEYTGGDFVLRFDGVEKRYNFGSGIEEHGARFHAVAFFTDVEHCVEPVQSGYRATLAYNLLSHGDAPVPEPPKHDNPVKLDQPLHESISALVNASPRPVMWLLKHNYTSRSLSVQHLKGGDRYLVNYLVRSLGPGIDMHLALLRLRGMGYGEDDSDDVVYAVSEALQTIPYAMSVQLLASCHVPLVASALRKPAPLTIGHLDEHYLRGMFTNGFNVRDIEPNMPDEELETMSRMSDIINIDISKLGKNQGLRRWRDWLKLSFQQNGEHTGNEGVMMDLQYVPAAIVFRRAAEPEVANRMA